MRVNAILSKLGYSQNEIKIYLASLKIGAATVTDLAKEVDMPRSTVKELAAAMHKKEILNYYKRKGRPIWFAENPDKLLIQLQVREAAFAEIIPFLKSLRIKNSDAPKINLFSGVQEVKLILEDIIFTQSNLKSVISWDDWMELFGREYVEDFIERRRKHNLRIKLLTPRTQTANILKAKDYEELRQTRFLSSDTKFGTSNFFYGNKVAIISLKRNSPIGIVIEDEDVAKTMNIFFESLWSQSS